MSAIISIHQRILIAAFWGITGTCVDKVLPGQQAVVSSIIIILELDHIQLRVVILTGLDE